MQESCVGLPPAVNLASVFQSVGSTVISLGVCFQFMQCYHRHYFQDEMHITVERPVKLEGKSKVNEVISSATYTRHRHVHHQDEGCASRARPSPPSKYHGPWKHHCYTPPMRRCNILPFQTFILHLLHTPCPSHPRKPCAFCLAQHDHLS